jgi:hypothetical protein
VEGLLAGQHRSVRRGLAVEFAGHRAYEPGDDLRRLDWAVSARSDRLVVRLDAAALAAFAPTGVAAATTAAGRRKSRAGSTRNPLAAGAAGREQS